MVCAIWCLFIGVAILLVGLAWPATDGHHRCRQCLYDLHRHPVCAPGNRCPECGADLYQGKAVRLTRRSSGVAWTGAVIALVSVVAMFMTSSRGSTWCHQHKPFWWVLAAAETEPGGPSNNDYSELRRRLLEQPCDPVHVRRFLDVAMTEADPKTGLRDGRWFPVLAELHRAGVLGDSELAAWLGLSPPEIQLGEISLSEVLFGLARSYEPGGRSVSVAIPMKIQNTQRFDQRTRTHLRAVVRVLGSRQGTWKYFWDPGDDRVRERSLIVDRQLLLEQEYLEVIITYELNGRVLVAFTVTREVNTIPDRSLVDRDEP